MGHGYKKPWTRTIDGKRRDSDAQTLKIKNNKVQSVDDLGGPETKRTFGGRFMEDDDDDDDGGEARSGHERRRSQGASLQN
jgi:hypothetical protein